MRRALQRWRRPRHKECKKDLGLGIGEAVRRQVESLLVERGFPSGAVGGESPWLWCLGGEEVYRIPLSEDDVNLDPMSCVDFHLYVCETHQTISAEVGLFDLVPEGGGSNSDDPRRSTPIDLGDTSEVVANAVMQLASWLDETVVAPNPGIS